MLIRSPDDRRRLDRFPGRHCGRLHHPLAAKRNAQRRCGRHVAHGTHERRPGSRRWARRPRRRRTGQPTGDRNDSKITSEATLAGGEATVDLRAAILNGIEAANQAVRELGTGAATTLALVEIQDRTIRTYHVGDSEILVTGQRGKVKLQTIPHSPIGYAVEAGLMEEEEAIHHEARHVISNVIGSDQMRIEMGPPTEMAPRDTLLLASDGLFDNLFPDEIVEAIRSGPLDNSIGSLVEAAQGRMATSGGTAPSKPDDLTVIAFRRA